MTRFRGKSTFRVSPIGRGIAFATRWLQTKNRRCEVDAGGRSCCMEDETMRQSEACSVEEILIGELRQLYRTAQQMLSVVPQVLSTTPSTDAREALRDQVDDTKTRLERLNARCEDLGIALDRVHSSTMICEGTGAAAGGNMFDERGRRNPAWHQDRALERNRSAKSIKLPEPPWLYSAR